MAGTTRRRGGCVWPRAGWCRAGKGRLGIACGAAGAIVAQALEGKVSLGRGTTFADVVARARRAAQRGDVVLLSPACSRYDMFKNYEERGATFRKIVEAM